MRYACQQSQSQTFVRRKLFKVIFFFQVFKLTHKCACPNACVISPPGHSSKDPTSMAVATAKHTSKDPTATDSPSKLNVFSMSFQCLVRDGSEFELQLREINSALLTY